VPHVIVAVSPRRAETVPRIRIVEGWEEDGWKACRWEGRRRGVGRDIVASAIADATARQFCSCVSARYVRILYPYYVL
jgi:hypothetical protein